MRDAGVESFNQVVVGSSPTRPAKGSPVGHRFLCLLLLGGVLLAQVALEHLAHGNRGRLSISLTKVNWLAGLFRQIFLEKREDIVDWHSEAYIFNIFEFGRNNRRWNANHVTIGNK